MDAVKLIVIVLLIVFAVAAVGVLLANSPMSGGPEYFDKLSTRQQAAPGYEVSGSPIEVLTEIV